MVVVGLIVLLAVFVAGVGSGCWDGSEWIR